MMIVGGPLQHARQTFLGLGINILCTRLPKFRHRFLHRILEIQTLLYILNFQKSLYI